MSEEEKEALEKLKLYSFNAEKLYKTEEYFKESNDYNIKLSLQVIDKQQEEIKDLKADRDYYKEMYYKIAFPEEELRIKGLGVD